MPSDEVTAMRPMLLQLCDLMPSVQARLDAGYAVHRWPRDESARQALLVEVGPQVEAVLTAGNLGIDTALAQRLPKLRIVAIHGVGYDQVDLPAMQALDVRVTNTPDVLTDDVADLAIALMLNVMRRLPAAEAHVRAGDWAADNVPPARRASGLRYGIVGLGRIGTAIAARLGGFGGSIAYTGRARKSVSHDFHDTLLALAAASDVLFVAAAASVATVGLIDRAVLDALGPQGVLVNIARGALVDEAAMVAALLEGRIWGAGLDVFEREPTVPEALLHLPNVALSPHVGSATVQTRAAMGSLVIDNLDALFAGKMLPSRVV